MRRDHIANWLFALSAAAFGAVFCWRLHDDSLYVSAAYFLFQSAFIGCAADWFAVTALFRRPLGIPFHTALIPRNRARIIRSIRQVAEKKLLSPAMWRGLAERFSMTGWLGHIWDSPQGRRIQNGLIEWIAGYVPGFLLKKLGEGSRSWTEPAAQCLLEEARQALLREGGAGRVLCFLLRALGEELQTPRGRERIEGWLREFTVQQKNENPLVATAVRMGEAMGVISYEDMAAAAASAAAVALQEWQDPAHIYMKEKLERILSEELSRPDTRELICRHLAAALEEIAGAARLGSAAEDFLGEGGPGRQLLRQVIVDGAAAILRGAVMRARIDEAVSGLLAGVASYEHTFIGDAVEDVLLQYDEEALNRFIYDKTADEFGSIRINGALIGAACGGVLFTLLLCLP